MHAPENFFPLQADLNPKILSRLRQFLLEFLVIGAGRGEIDDHDHIENIGHDRLGDIEDIGIGLGKHSRYRGNDAHSIAAQHGNNSSHSLLLS
jgi:hypothetical protein